jgi:hypothetical protein
VPRSAFVFTLYKLKVEDGTLILSIKNIDYLWLINAEDVLDAEGMALHKKLRSISDIQFVTLLEKEKIKNIEFFIL